MNVVGEAIKWPVLIAKTHKITVAPSPPNSIGEKERVRAHRPFLQPVNHIEIHKEVHIMEANMVPNNTRKITITKTVKESLVFKTTTGAKR